MTSLWASRETARAGTRAQGKKPVSRKETKLLPEAIGLNVTKMPKKETLTSKPKEQAWHTTSDMTSASYSLKGQA
jgi:hypothetical protein